jgi:hypothetical protein
LKPTETAQVKQARLAAIVIFVTMIVWMALQWIGGKIGLEARYVFLFDLSALAAFAWSLIVLFRVWRARQ